MRHLVRWLLLLAGVMVALAIAFHSQSDVVRITASCAAAGGVGLLANDSLKV